MGLLTRGISKVQRKVARTRDAAKVATVLSSTNPTKTLRAEGDFEKLQQRYTQIKGYGYDRISLLERATGRVSQILGHLPRGDKSLSVLDVGAGEGTLGVIFAAVGHQVSLCDLDDWRAESAKSLQFAAADCCVALPHKTGAFDIVAAFNSFEHLSDPQQAFNEIVRVTRSGGLIYLDFGPLYCSPWGLHAYRTLRMPYPQYLFSKEFLKQKLTEIGIVDLGQERSELQFVNGWKSSQFTKLWDTPSIKVISERISSEERHLDIIQEYPECFSGRGLTYNDVTHNQIRVALVKST
jgi:SAM-dependent methyltransferase